MLSLDRQAGRLALAFVATALVLAVTAAEAQARPDTRRMSCAQAQDFVRRSGAVVISTGQFTYDRFVASQGFCSHDEETAVKRVPTTDVSNCPLYYCRPASIFRDPPLIFRR